MAERLRFRSVSPSSKEISSNAEKSGSYHSYDRDGDDLLALREADCSIVMVEGDRRRCNLVLLDPDFNDVPDSF